MEINSYLSLCPNLLQTLKKLISIFLISLLIFPSVKKFAIFADFQLNRISIAEEHCENIVTDKNCQGTCHLVKEIKKESPEEKKTPFTSNDSSKNETLFFENDIEKINYLSNITPISILLINLDFDSHVIGVFHPPKSSILC